MYKQQIEALTALLVAESAAGRAINTTTAKRLITETLGLSDQRPVDALNFDERTNNALKQFGIETVAQLRNTPEVVLLPALGVSRVKKIIAALSAPAEVVCHQCDGNGCTSCEYRGFYDTDELAVAA